MIEDYITYLENLISKMAQYYAAGKNFGMLDSDCLKEKICAYNLVLEELKTLDENVDDDLDYFEEIKYYVGKLESCVDIGKILTTSLFITTTLLQTLGEFTMGDGGMG